MERETILRKIVMPKELCIIRIFDFLNKEFINRDYEFGDIELDRLLEFIRSDDEELLSTIWNKNSIQKKFFLDTLKICDFYCNNPKVSEDERKDFFLDNCLDLFEVEDKLYRIYLLATKKEKNCIYDDKDFAIYTINSREDEKNIYWKEEDVFFHIILDGVSLLKEQGIVLSAEDVYFSRDLPDIENFLPVNNKYKKLIFVVKNSFFTTTQIKLNKIRNKRINFVGNRNLISLLLKKDGSNLNKIYVFQMGIYMIELLNVGKVEITNIPYIDLKKDIVSILDENICLDKKEIIEILLTKLNISSSKLYKVFYTLFDSSASKYIDKLKLDKACYYLQQPKQVIEDISYKVGMSEQTFLRKFYEEFGVTPANFVKGVEDDVDNFGKNSC